MSQAIVVTQEDAISAPEIYAADVVSAEDAKLALYKNLDDLVLELQEDPRYCGMNIDIIREKDEGNKIVCIQLVPVDLIEGNPARRI